MDEDKWVQTDVFDIKKNNPVALNQVSTNRLINQPTKN